MYLWRSKTKHGVQRTLFSNFVAGAFSFNIALGKKAQLCDEAILPAGLLDGITNISIDIVDVKRHCTLGILVIYIGFDDYYFVHYVTLHPGAADGEQFSDLNSVGLKILV